MIPKIIHQLWIGDKKMPIEWMKKWAELNPSWEHRIWTEKELEAEKPFINGDLIHLIPEMCGRKDVYQYEILQRYGGFFIDADAEPFKPIPDHILNTDLFTCWEHETARKGIVALGYVASIPNHPIFPPIIREVRDLRSYSPAWKTLGQMLWTKHVLSLFDAQILPSGLFIPLHYTGTPSPTAELAICKQHWGSTLKIYST